MTLDRTHPTHITLCRFAPDAHFTVMEQDGTYAAAYDHAAEHLGGPHSAADIRVYRIDAMTDITADVLAQIKPPAADDDADWAYEPEKEGPGWHDV